MDFLTKIKALGAWLKRVAVKQGQQLEKSNEKTIAYIKRLRMAADSELRRIISEENSQLWGDAEKVRAAKFILCHRG